MSFSKEDFVDGVVRYLKGPAGISTKPELIDSIKSNDLTFETLFDLLNKYLMYVVSDGFNKSAKQDILDNGLESTLENATPDVLATFIKWAAALFLSEFARSTKVQQTQPISV